MFLIQIWILVCSARGYLCAYQFEDVFWTPISKIILNTPLLTLIFSLSSPICGVQCIQCIHDYYYYNFIPSLVITFDAKLWNRQTSLNQMRHQQQSTHNSNTSTTTTTTKVLFIQSNPSKLNWVQTHSVWSRSFVYASVVLMFLWPYENF